MNPIPLAVWSMRPVERGEFRPDVDPEALFSMDEWPIDFQMFIAGRPVDDEFIDTIVGNLCWLYCSPSTQRSFLSRHA